MTVRQAYAQLASAGLIRQKRGQGTFVKKTAAKPQIAQSASTVISVLLPSPDANDHLKNPAWFNIEYTMQGFSEMARADGFSLDLVYIDPDQQSPKEGAELLLKRNVAGFALPINGYYEIVEHLQAAGKVCVLREPEPCQYNCVYGTMRSGVTDAVTHLLDHGRKRIACFTGSLRSRYEKAKYEGYTQAIESRGIRQDTIMHMECDYLPEHGYHSLLKMLNRGQNPDAVFAGTDLRAFGVIRAAREKGLNIPQDLAVIGSDDLPECLEHNPPLSTVKYPMREIGRTMFAVLQRAIRYPQEQPIQQAVPCRFIVRKSG